MPTPDAHDPQGLLAWATAIIDTFRAAWVAVFIPIGGVIAWWMRTGNSRRDRALEREDNARIELDKEQMEEFARLRAENMALRKDAEDRERAHRAEIKERETTINRLIGNVRSWYGLAHESWHKWAGVVTIANMRLAKAGAAEIEAELCPLALSHDIDAPIYLPQGRGS